MPTLTFDDELDVPIYPLELAVTSGILDLRHDLDQLRRHLDALVGHVTGTADAHLIDRNLDGDLASTVLLLINHAAHLDDGLRTIEAAAKHHQPAASDPEAQDART